MSNRNMVNITITMTREERKALKQLALDEDTTASEGAYRAATGGERPWRALRKKLRSITRRYWMS